MSALTGIVDRYAQRESPIHRADARSKLLGAVLYILGITATREGDWVTLALLALPLLAVIGVSRLGFRFVLRRTFLALPFVLVALPLLFTREGEALFTLPLTGWTASEAGLEAVTTIFARSWLAVGVAAVFVAATPPVELLRALRWLHVPRLLVSTLFFTYRYLFVIAEEAQRMLRARASRSAALAGRRAGGTIAWRARVAGYMVGSLFVRSLERSERVYAAMQARGYAGEARFLEERAPRAIEVAAASSLAVYAITVQLAARAL